MLDDFLYQKFREKVVAKIRKKDWKSVPEDPDGELYQNICNKAYNLINHMFDFFGMWGNGLLLLFVVLPTGVACFLWGDGIFAIEICFIISTILVVYILGTLFQGVFEVKIVEYLAILEFLEERDNRDINDYYGDEYSDAAFILCTRRLMIPHPYGR